MKKFLVTLAVVAMAGTAFAQSWTQTVGDMSLLIARSDAGGGVWRWTYTLVQDVNLQTPPVTDPGAITYFTAQWPLLDFGGTAGGYIYNYDASEEPLDQTNPPTTSYSMLEIVWVPSPGQNNSMGLWYWQPTPNAGEMGTKYFEIWTRYQEIGSGTYEAYTMSTVNPQDPEGDPVPPYQNFVHTFQGMAMPIPEPATTAMVLMAMCGGLVIRRRR